MEKKEIQTESKKHVHEIDLIRSISVFSVVALHTLSYTKFLIKDIESLRLFYILGHTLNYNREMFMFVTAFVLTYVYLPREISLKKFYMRRLLIVFIPYVLWSVIYLLIRHFPTSLPQFLTKTFDAVLTGDASFQLYYILLTLQFYAIFPFFLVFIKKVKQRPWIALSIGLVIQLLWMYYDFNYIQTGVHTPPEFLERVVKYRDRIFLVYGFFFLLGGISAVYFESARRLLVRYASYIPVLFASAITLYSLHYFYQFTVQKIPIMRAAGALQPSVVLYSIAVIIFFMWIATRWAEKRRLHTIVHTISNTSFGIFFVHVLALDLTRSYFLPIIPSFVPVFFQIFLVLIVAFGSSVLISQILIKTPFLGWTVGRPKK